MRFLSRLFYAIVGGIALIVLALCGCKTPPPGSCREYFKTYDRDFVRAYEQCSKVCDDWFYKCGEE